MADRYFITGQVFVTNGTGVITEAGRQTASITLHVTTEGTFTFSRTEFVTASVSSGTATVTDSPKSISLTPTVVTVTGTGTIELTMSVPASIDNSWSVSANWSATSGGVGGASVPTSSDNVYFDANSFPSTGMTVLIDAANQQCASMNWTGATNSPIFRVNNDGSYLNLKGNCTFIAAMSISANSGPIVIGAACTLVTNGLNLNNIVYIQVDSDLTLGSAITTWRIALQAGSLTTNNYNMTFGGGWTIGFGSGAKTVTLGSSTINTPYVEYTGTNLTVAANTATINISGTGACALGSANWNGASFNLNGTAHTVSGSPTGITTFRRTGTATKTDTVTFTSGTTVTCTNFALIGNSATNRLLAQSSTLGTAATITATNQAFSNTDFMDITLTNAYDHTANLLTNVGFEDGDPPTGWTSEYGVFSRSSAQAHGGTYSGKIDSTGHIAGQSYQQFSLIVYRGIRMILSGYAYATDSGKVGFKIYDGITDTISSYHSGVAGWEQLSVTHLVAENASYTRPYIYANATSVIAYWDDVSLNIAGTIGDCGGNTGIIFTAPAAQSSVGAGNWSDATKWTSRVPLPQDDVTCSHSKTVDMPRIGKSINFTGTPTVTYSVDSKYYGSFTLASGMTFNPDVREIIACGRSSYTITTAGKSLRNLRIDAPGGTYTLQDNCTVTDSVLIRAGTFDFNDKNVTAPIMSEYIVSGTTRTLYLGNGTFTLNSSGAVTKWNYTGTVYAESSTIILTNSGTSAQTFTGNGATFNNVTIQGAGNYTLALTGSNTFNTLTIDRSAAAKTVLFSAGGSTTLAHLVCAPAGTTVVTLGSTGAGAWGLTTTTSGVVRYYYMDLSYSAASPTATWAAYDSTDSGNNTGWYINGGLPLSVSSHAYAAAFAMGDHMETFKNVKHPIISVSIFRFLEGYTPGVDTDGVEYKPGIISCNITAGYDQISTTANITLLSPKDDDGNDVTFKPMDRVVVSQGWESTSDLKVTFFGFIDEVYKEMPDKIQRIVCRDILKLPQNKYYLKSDRKMFYYEQVPGEYEDDGVTPINCHTPEAERKLETVVSGFLVESGIPVGHHKLPDCNIITLSGAIPLIIGTNKPVEFVYTSAMDALQLMCDYTGYKIWADPTGMVRMSEVSMVAAGDAAHTFKTQLEIRDRDRTIRTRKGNIIALETTVNDDLRNWIEVYNPGDTNIRSKIYGDSPYVTDPPKYRKTEITSYMLDTQPMVDAIANKMYNELNRLRYSARATVEGNNTLQIGQTIEILDEFATVSGIKYLLYDYSTTHDANGYIAELNLVGGTGDGSVPLGHQDPVAQFFAKPVRATDAAGNAYTIVTVDGTQSYDPDGSIASYLWESPGFANGTNSTNVYTVSGSVSSLVVTLTVTDNTGDTDSMTKVIPLTAYAGSDIKTLTIFVANDDAVSITRDGGENWASVILT